MAVYPSYEDAETNLPKRKEFQNIVKDKFTVVDSFYYEGDITYFENSKAAIKAGANILVSGTTIFKDNNGDIKRNIELLRSK